MHTSTYICVYHLGGQCTQRVLTWGYYSTTRVTNVPAATPALAQRAAGRAPARPAFPWARSSVWWSPLQQHWFMFCKKSFQSSVPPKREFGVRYEISSHFMRWLQAFSVLLLWTALCRNPRQGFPSSLTQTWPGPVAFPCTIRICKRSSTAWPTSNELLFGSSLSNLPAPWCRTWLHQQKGSCRLGKFPSKQQRLRTLDSILDFNLTYRREV